MQTSNKRKGICLETSDEPTAMKLPKFGELVLDRLILILILLE